MYRIAFRRLPTIGSVGNGGGYGGANFCGRDGVAVRNCGCRYSRHVFWKVRRPELQDDISRKGADFRQSSPVARQQLQ